MLNRAIILFLFVQVLYAAPSKLVVAVGAFESNGVPASDVNILVDRLRNELMNTGTFRVMERSMMDEILKEQAFQQSGICNTRECQVQVGQFLGVDRMIVGSIGLLGGSVYTVSARILDVATGEVVKTVSEDYQGDIAGVLSRAMPRVASKLANTSKDSVIPMQTGSLWVNTSPEGARVVLDGREQTGTTPLTLKDLAPSKHRVEVRKDNLLGSQEVLVKAGVVAKTSIPLKLGTGTVVAASTPAGAAVWLDGDSVGLAPIRLQCTAETHRLEFRKGDYQRFERHFTVNVGGMDSIHAELKPGARLTLSVTPDDAQIEIDGKLTGWEGSRVFAPGPLVVRVSKEGYAPWSRYEPWESRIDLRESQVLQVSLNKRPLGAQKTAALWVWGGSAVLSVTGMVFNARGDGYQDDYEMATTKSEGTDAYDKVKDADLYRNIAYSMALTGIVTGVVLWLWN